MKTLLSRLIRRLVRFEPRRSAEMRIRAADHQKRFPGARIAAGSKIPPRGVTIGRGTYGRPEILTFSDTDTVEIGNFCSIGPHVLIVAGGEHRLGLATTYPIKTYLARDTVDRDAVAKGGVVVGHDVWLGARTTILSGVTIGNGAVVGAGSLVTKDVPAYAVAVGNPARVLRYRFDEPTRQALDRIQWWTWSDDEIRARLEELYLPAEEFALRVSPN